MLLNNHLYIEKNYCGENMVCPSNLYKMIGKNLPLKNHYVTLIRSIGYSLAIVTSFFFTFKISHAFKSDIGTQAVTATRISRYLPAINKEACPPLETPIRYIRDMSRLVCLYTYSTGTDHQKCIHDLNYFC